MDHLMREAVRYLGYGKHAVDDQTLGLIADSFGSLRTLSSRKSVYRIFDLEQEDGETVWFGSLTVKSKSLGKNLRGCDKIVLFGATLGIGVDQLLSRTSKTDMAKTVVLQACAAALLEEYCDECQERIRQEMESEGRYLRPRFSPGYGDFPIECQRDMVRMLDCAKSIGLTLTESCMMAPSKSVTAVIGAGRAAVRCHRQGCESCEKLDCIYRRDTL
ncbi:MAG: Vitamin B12 dependent methionine synthase activation subunit [Schaedlerella sp.]|uniref:vitamin B12 dependent-methionine synthase activation domain-containing protein n=1 Tax=Schaedlerella sp. TaxID=2676057 RepID=UPI00261D0241|nr:vitamin B12 dependent-methionine synthase activation domain-containing protein [uncultured Schaedlerella sp.]